MVVLLQVQHSKTFPMTGYALSVVLERMISLQKNNGYNLNFLTTTPS